jgi:hypothetical protein
MSVVQEPSTTTRAINAAATKLLQKQTPAPKTRDVRFQNKYIENKRVATDLLLNSLQTDIFPANVSPAGTMREIDQNITLSVAATAGANIPAPTELYAIFPVAKDYVSAVLNPKTAAPPIPELKENVAAAAAAVAEAAEIVIGASDTTPLFSDF